ncbi:MAG: biotin/lipoyl-binding protein [Symploca sp. SIO2C1]|nr:biotin/lipoyl-binding protein [Symploca sp. SIO2C1]
MTTVSSKSHPALKIVSPTPSTSTSDTNAEEDTKAPSELPPQEQVNNSPLPTTSKRRWLFLGAAILGLSAVASIPLPHYVTGEAEITSRRDAREQLTMTASGRVQIHVRANQQVQPGDLIAEIQSDELDNQLAEAERELERAEQGVRGANQQLMLAEARLSAAQNHEKIARERTQRSSRELKISSSLPQVQRLEREREAFSSEIAAIEASIAGIEAEITGLQGELSKIDDIVAMYQSLESKGAIGKKQLLEVQREQVAVKGQIEQRKNAIAAQRRQIQQQESLKAAHTAQIGEANQQLSDTLDTDADELKRVAAQTMTAKTEVAAAVAHIQSQKELVDKWETDIQQLEQQREKLQLVAQKAGTVITRDLDLLNGKRLEAGEEILEVVDLEQLTAQVRIRQEDKDLVNTSAKVRFYRQGDRQHYSAVVEDSSIVPVVQTEENQQKPMVEVRIAIDNRERLLLPGVEGYAHIDCQNLRVYQKVGREFNKLFNLGKYFPGLKGE